MTMEIRIASMDDAGALLPMIAALYAHEEIPFDEAALRPALEGILSDETIGFVCMMAADGAPAGYLIATFGYDIEFGGRQATITDVYVQPDRRRRGLASAALRFAETQCRKKGVRALEMQVSHANAAAGSVYEAAGFAASGRFVMSKRLV